ncbi:MAG: hypothetical protein R3A79_10095 [Nannocystaceae bacterium]
MRPIRLVTTTLALPLCLAFAACAGDDVGTADTEQATDGATGTGTDSGTSTGQVDVEPYPARGLTITRVELNQGVAIPIGLDGAEVGGAGRNAYVVPRRDTLIRVYVDVADDWVEREIEGRLTLVQTDGTEKVISELFMISEDTRDSGITTGPYFGVEAGDMLPGVKYKVSLWETQAGYETEPEPVPAPMLPVDGSTAFVGVEDSYQSMRVVLVPVDYSYGDCEAVVDGDEVQGPFHTALLQQNPVENLELEVHAPYKVTYDMTKYNGLNQLVNEMSQLRAAEGAAPEVYYYGIFDNCGRCIGSGDINGGCTVGLAANITGDGKSDAWGRAAAGQLNGSADATFVHEIGHTQGRRHIECAGAGVQAAGTDNSYPYDGGSIHVWGFGIRDYGLRHPTANSDYMSYCSKSWCSDWQWNATYKRIKTLSSWETEGAAAPEGRGPGLLIGSVDPDGNEDWWTVPGALAGDAERSLDHAVRFAVDGEERVEAAQISLRPHGSTINVVVPLPEGIDLEAAQLRYDDGDEVRAIVLDPAKVLHRGDWLTAQ